MKYLLLRSVTLSFVFFLTASKPNAQGFEGPGEYMEYIGKASEKITSMYLSYLSAVGNGKSARKVDKRREELIAHIFNTRLDIQGMPPYKGDKSYRDTTVAYYKLLYHVFNEDFKKIVNMEEIAEQSYDAMEAYMMAQEAAQEKLAEAAERQQVMQKEFAARYDIKLVNNVSELDIKSKQASELMKHYSEVYLIFFKVFHQESYVMAAIANKDLNAIEQSRNALLKYAVEGLQKLKAVKPYNKDPTIVIACREALTFYKEEAEQLNYVTDFWLQEEAFGKMKKALDSKPATQRTKQEIDQFNKGVKDINFAINNFNNSNNNFNKERSRVLNNWNNMVKKYLDNYMPLQRKG